MKTLLALLALCLSTAPALAKDKDMPSSRVIAKQTLRCSYSTLSPFIIVDAKDGRMSGVLYDLWEEMGKRLGLKVEWTEEVSYGQISAGFGAGKYDAYCGVLWATPARATAMAFSNPFYYNTVHPCVAGKSAAYDKSVAPLNAEGKKLIGWDGDISSEAARRFFPKAQIVSVPENVSFAETMTWIATGKADALATCDRIIVDDYNKTNPEGLKVAAPDRPLTYIQVAAGLPLGDTVMKNMIDTAIFAMQADGTMEKIMTPYLKERMKDTIIIPQIDHRNGEKR